MTVHISTIFLTATASILILGLSSFCVGTDYPGVEWMPSPHFHSGRNGSMIRWIIVHGTAGCASGVRCIGEWFQNPASQAASHYTVGQDGAIVQSVREADTAWANRFLEEGADSWWTGEPYYSTISIEHVKPHTDNSDLITPIQKNVSFTLIQDIIHRNPGIRSAWANADGGITGHYSISPINKKFCPGPYPWAELFEFLQKNENSDGQNGSNSLVKSWTILILSFFLSELCRRFLN